MFTLSGLHFGNKMFQFEIIARAEVDCGLLEEQFELKIIEFQDSMKLMQEHRCFEKFCDFWKTVDKQKFPVT